MSKKQKISKQQAKFYNNVTSTDNILTYNGQVKVKYKIGDKEVIFKQHNEGLDGLFRFICKALSGNIAGITAEKPAFLDLICIYDDITNISNEVSCLYNEISLSHPEYLYDQNIRSWITRFNITISYSMINYDIINSHNNGKFYLYLKAADGTNFARMSLTDANIDLAQLFPGMQLIVEWIMMITNTEENSGE